MKLSKRILSWLSVLAMVATLFSGVIAVSADEVDLTTLDKVVAQDFSDTDAGTWTPDFNSGNGWATGSMVLNATGIGTGWEGFAFWLSMGCQYGVENFMPYLSDGSGMWGAANGITLVATDGTVTELAPVQAYTAAYTGMRYVIPAGFEGWVYVAKSSIANYLSYGYLSDMTSTTAFASLNVEMSGWVASTMFDNISWLVVPGCEEHAWMDATCQAPKTCSVCGATEGEVGDHSWVDATCTTAKTCSVCKATDGEALGHSYADGVCTVCGGLDFPSFDKANAQAAEGAMNPAMSTTNGISSGSVALDASAVTGAWYGYAFYLSIPTFYEDGSNAVQHATDFMPYLQDAAGMLWGPANGITLVATDGTVTELTPTAAYNGNYGGCRYTVPDDFEGWVYVAKSSMAQFWGGVAYLSESALASSLPTFGIEFGGWINTGVVENVSWLIIEGDVCEHEWVDATCTAAKYCPLCGATEGEALGHSYVNYICTNCGVPNLVELEKVTIDDFSDIDAGNWTPTFNWGNGWASGTTALKAVDTDTKVLGYAFHVSLNADPTQSATNFTPYLLDADGMMWAAADGITLIADDGTVTDLAPLGAYDGNYNGCRYTIAPGNFSGWVYIAASSLAKFYNGYEYLSAPITSMVSFGIEHNGWINEADYDDLSWLVVPACEEHTWDEATCTDPETCSVCGATQGEALGHNYVEGVCTECWDDQRIYLQEETNTLTVGAGETVYYASYNGGTIATLMGGGLTVSHNGQEYQLAGVVSFDFVANMRQPGVIKVVNNTAADMTFTLTFTYPVGSTNNPQVITENGDYTAENVADYYYSFTAPEDGTVTVTMSGDNWLYAINNMTTGIHGDQHWNDDDPAVPSETVEVLEGDEIVIMVAHYDGHATETGTVTWNFTFGDMTPDLGTLVSTQKYNNRLTFEVYEMADGSHKLVVSGTGVMPTAKQAAGYEFLNYSATIDEIVIGEGVTTVGYGIFNGWTALSSVSLPSTLTTIDGESFRGCTALKAIDIPDSVTTLGYMAFSASGLESIVIPASVTDIKNYVFYRCKSLVSAEIYGSTAYKVGSKTYRATGARMFSECSKLENIVLGDVITLLNTYTFHGAALTEFTVPARVKFIYDAAFHSNTKMTKFVMEEGVTYLGWAALFGCSSLTDVTIPETITGGNIATWAFGACTSLESIELPSKLTNLKKRTFSGCTSLKSIELPETVTTLGDRVFIGCTALESVKLSNITKIDVQTFNNCPKLQSITIPETVTSIGDLAFRLNSSLKTVYIDSATIAAGLTGNAVYGNMIKWAETIAIRADIENVPSYVTSNYKTVGSVTVDGVEYVTYSK